MHDITRILSAIEQGDPRTSEQLLPLVYEELRQLARQRLAREMPGQTLQATALVHEAYLRLANAQQAQAWDSRGHFFAAAAEAMRRILVDVARLKGSDRRGGGRKGFELLDGDLLTFAMSDEILDLDEALTRLGEMDGRAAELVKLRVFAGMTIEEAASHLGVSPRTANRSWAYARAWLGREMAGGRASSH